MTCKYHLTIDNEPWEATSGVYVAFICVASAAVPLAIFGLMPLGEVQLRVTRLGLKLAFLEELQLTLSCFKDTNLLILLLPSFASGIPTVAVSTTNGKCIGNMGGDC